MKPLRLTWKSLQNPCLFVSDGTAAQDVCSHLTSTDSSVLQLCPRASLGIGLAVWFCPVQRIWRDFSCWVHSFSTWRKEAAKSWLCKASCALVLCNTNKSHKSLFFCLWSCVYPADTGHRIHLQTWNFNLLWLTMQQIIFVVWTVLWWKRISDRVFRQPVSQRSSFRTAFPIVPSKSQPCLSGHVELLARWSSSCFLSLWGWARPFDLCP